MSAVYFGINTDEVANATGAPPVTKEGSFDPGSLALGTTYYWRVDMFDGIQWTKGEVWSFTTLPDVSIADSNLTVWWTLDEGPGGAMAVDWSGHGHHGTLIDDPQWVDGKFGKALQFDGVNDYVIHQLPQAQNYDDFTVALWVRAATPGQGEWMLPLQAFTDQGFNLADVDSIAIGLGTKAGVAATGGSGMMYFDDIRLYRP